MGIIKLSSEQSGKLVNQFILTRDRGHEIPGWIKRSKDYWHLLTHPKLHVCDIIGSDLNHIGWVLGFPITRFGEFSPDNIYISSDCGTLEEQIYTLGGRFIAIILSPEISRVYLDASGSLAMVYSKNERIVASTPGFFKQSGYPENDALIRELSISNKGLWFPNGLTPRKHIYRLLPNHYLDLDSWVVKRHWPSLCGTGSIGINNDISTLIGTIVSQTQCIIKSIARHIPLQIPLTAGRDSRMLLACARTTTDDTIFFTFSKGSDSIDSRIAVKLEKKLGLTNNIIKIDSNKDQYRDEWHFKTGGCIVGDISNFYPTFHRLSPNHALLPGMAGEVGRSYYWTESDTEGVSLDEDELLKRCKLPVTDQIGKSMAVWLDGLSGFNTFAILDLLYIEQRLGCWAGPQQYGADEFVTCHLIPFSHRTTFSAMMSLPWTYRVDQKMATDVCNRMWPELLSIPFNQETGTRRLRTFNRKLVNRCKKILLRN